MRAAVTQLLQILDKICNTGLVIIDMELKENDVSDELLKALVVSIVHVDKLLMDLSKDPQSWNLESIQNGIYYFEKVRISLRDGKWEPLCKMFQQHGYEAGLGCAIVGLISQNGPVIGVGVVLMALRWWMGEVPADGDVNEKQERFQIKVDEWNEFFKMREQALADVTVSVPLAEEPSDSVTSNLPVECVVCKEDRKGRMVILAPCGHCVCLGCRNQIAQCMICRTEIESHIKKVFAN